MTQSQQIEKDMAEAMSEVCILPLQEQGRFHLQLFRQRLSHESMCDKGDWHCG